MASYFIYDSINQYRSDNTLSEGSISGTTPTKTFSASNTLINHERASDQNIGTIITGVNTDEAIKYALGGDETANAAAVYFTGASTGSSPVIRILKGTSGSITDLGEIPTATSAGWQVDTFTETTDDEWYAQFTGTIANVSEILIGKKLNFEIEPDVNVQSSINYENEVQRSLGGVEYAINVNPGQEVFTISFQNISSTFKSDLITMQDAIKGEAKKFVWYDGTNHHFVRLDKPMVMTEIADGRFSTQLVLRQQIQ